MSFIVKGVDLPKDKAIAIHYANRYGEMETILVSESDIIQIPKDHGRLIDADALETDLKIWLTANGINRYTQYLGRMLLRIQSTK